MTRGQVSFALADHEVLAGARLEGCELCVGEQRFDTVVLPAEVALPKDAAAALRRFEADGGRVLRERPREKIEASLVAKGYDSGRLDKPADRLVMGRFMRQGREILVLVNVGTAPCERTISAGNAAKWVVADPSAGTIARVLTAVRDRIVVSLPPRATRIFIAPARRGASDERGTRMAPSAS
jgi:hypothetical protein